MKQLALAFIISLVVTPVFAEDICRVRNVSPYENNWQDLSRWFLGAGIALVNCRQTGDGPQGLVLLECQATQYGTTAFVNVRKAPDYSDFDGQHFLQFSYGLKKGTTLWQLTSLCGTDRVPFVSQNTPPSYSVKAVGKLK